jgi:predicted nucleic acid-binding protein
VIVVADTSPINYLVLTGCIDVLPALFGEVIVPQSVADELQHARTPPEVHSWAAQPPPWFVVRPALQVDDQIRLGRGETEAICLALEMHASLLLIDDRRGRREAIARGVPVAGTLNVLVAAAARGLLELPAAIQKLRATNFHLSNEVVAAALNEDAERRRGG